MGALLNQQEGAIAARWGGEEFVMAWPGCSIEETAQCCDQIRRVINDTTHLSPHGEAFRVTTSVGVAQAGAHESVDALFERADRALYEAKSSGRNRVGLASHDPLIWDETEVEIEERPRA